MPATDAPRRCGALGFSAAPARRVRVCAPRPLVPPVQSKILAIFIEKYNFLSAAFIFLIWRLKKYFLSKVFLTATVLDPRYKNLEFLDSASTRKEWYNASFKNINAYLTSILFDASLETSLNDSNTSLFSDAAIEDIELNSTQKELKEYKKVKK